jgi:hypothetical protein
MKLVTYHESESPRSVLVFDVYGSGEPVSLFARTCHGSGEPAAPRPRSLLRSFLAAHSLPGRPPARTPFGRGCKRGTGALGRRDDAGQARGTGSRGRQGTGSRGRQGSGSRGGQGTGSRGGQGTGSRGGQAADSVRVVQRSVCAGDNRTTVRPKGAFAGGRPGSECAARNERSNERGRGAAGSPDPYTSTTSNVLGLPRSVHVKYVQTSARSPDPYTSNTSKPTSAFDPNHVHESESGI